jgi:cysteine-rich repeat protein
MRSAYASSIAALLATGCIDWSSLYGGVCGNGRVEAGEECDDGDRDDTDACPSTCSWARCGDGFVRAHVEECDTASTDASSCGASCLSCSGPDDFLARSAQGDDAGTSTYARCYSFVAAAKSFDDASLGCNEMGASLVTYPSWFDPELVYGGLLKSHPATTYIGLARDKGNWYWLSGEGAPRRPFWASGQPAASPNDCVVQGPSTTSSNGYPLTWTAVACSSTHPYVCERSAPFVRPVNGHAYRLLYARASWDDAKATCAKLGGYLATIGDADEQTFVTSQGLLSDVWIGANDLASQGSFSWITGEPFTFARIAPWDGPSPSNRCLLLNRDSYWYTRRCSDANAYLCEIE